jgi:anti-sigma factor RsiW
MADLTCAEVVELVTEYLEGSLDEMRRSEFERHIAACDGCDNYLDQMRQTVALAGRVGEESLSPQACETLVEAFRRWRAG